MKLLPYAQLLRLPNVFTAFADIGMAALIAELALSDIGPFALVLLASGCLYCGGMVLNDWFDQDQDRRERPFRPIPSGRVQPRQALILGVALLGLGWMLATVSGWRSDGFRAAPAILGGTIVAAVLLYDGWLKRTTIGPISMAACRVFNVLLGFTVAAEGLAWDVRWHIASVVGLYIVGVTWFARKEAAVSDLASLKKAAVVMLLALGLALLTPLHFPAGRTFVLFPYLLVGFGFLVGTPVWHALARPSPALVQQAVKRAVLGLVVLDAVLASALAGLAGLLLLLLLPPALWLGRWVYST